VDASGNVYVSATLIDLPINNRTAVRRAGAKSSFFQPVTSARPGLQPTRRSGLVFDVLSDPGNAIPVVVTDSVRTVRRTPVRRGLAVDQFVCAQGSIALSPAEPNLLYAASPNTILSPRRRPHHVPSRARADSATGLSRTHSPLNPALHFPRNGGCDPSTGHRLEA